MRRERSDNRAWELRRMIVAALRREHGFMGACDLLGEFETLLRPLAESGVGAGVTAETANCEPEPQP